MKVKNRRIIVEQSRNSRVLASFIDYCVQHPHERFWQALRNWSGYGFILAAEYEGDPKKMHDGILWKSPIDTFHKEDK